MNAKHQRTTKLAPSQSYPARNLDEMGKRLGVDPVQAARPATSPATWPTGVSLLAQMVDACQRCEAEDVCNDWLPRAPKAIAAPPAFCPNAEALKKAKRS